MCNFFREHELILRAYFHCENTQLLVLLIAAAIMCVPSPSAPPEDKEPNSGDPGNALEASETENQPAGAGEDEAKPVKPIAPDSWEWVAAVGLTTLGLNAGESCFNFTPCLSQPRLRRCSHSLSR